MNKKFDSMRGKFVAALAAVLIDSLSQMPLWLETQIKVTERGMEDRVARRVWRRVTREWRECTLKMADRAGRDSVMMRKDWVGGGGDRKDFHEVLKNGLEIDS